MPLPAIACKNKTRDFLLLFVVGVVLMFTFGGVLWMWQAVGFRQNSTNIRAVCIFSVISIFENREKIKRHLYFFVFICRNLNNFLNLKMLVLLGMARFKIFLKCLYKSLYLVCGRGEGLIAFVGVKYLTNRIKNKQKKKIPFCFLI